MTVLRSNTLQNCSTNYEIQVTAEQIPHMICSVGWVEILPAGPVPPLYAPDLVYPAFPVGHGDIVGAADAEVFSSDGDVGAARLGTLVGRGRRVSEGGDLGRERGRRCTWELCISRSA